MLRPDPFVTLAMLLSLVSQVIIHFSMPGEKMMGQGCITIVQDIIHLNCRDLSAVIR